MWRASAASSPARACPEQQIASLCNVSRTPVRAALSLLAERGVVRWEADTGYHLAVDLTAQSALSAELPAAEEDELAEAILRDRSARRLDQHGDRRRVDAAVQCREKDGTKST